MKYDFDLTIGAEISAEVVEQMVAHIAEQQVGKKINSVEPIYKDGKFSGYTVAFTDEKANSTTEAFSPTTYARK